ncbi:MAG: UDP-3-O-[3-hydroxymyristoyl] N-acetylglucosamine deacetylase [Micavibrio sp.]|nr:UDP-3-O-[3-hydroxymyristoyl] N-acetylglucosamine deacetylase [Micavibrio sp.]
MYMQHTLQNSFNITDIGLHSGVDVSLTVKPAAPDHGVVFKRVDLQNLNEEQQRISAKWDRVVDTRLCTVIGNEHGAIVGTIEHLMAAIRAAGIDNALVEIDAGEVPVLDGSSIGFIEAIEEAGIQEQSQPRRAIRILKDVTVTDGNKSITLSPSAVPLYEGRIEYTNAAIIGDQSYTLKLVNGNFKHDVADCRTFGLLHEVEAMKAAGLGLGGSLDNAVIVDDDHVLNPDGVRHSDEFVRHKILDAVGDLALAGGLVIGHYKGLRAGHDMNNKILKALFADDSAWEIVDLYVDIKEADMAVYQQNTPKIAVTPR